jgi:ribose transport system ATP-binding protein
MSAPLLEMRGVEKRFGGVRALRGVDFDLLSGEVHVLLGENGAGKSTLMSVLSGVIAPDPGTVALAGQPVRFANPREAHAAGIVMIPQELDLVPGLDIASNLFLGSERLTPYATLAKGRMLREARALLARAGVSLDASLPVSSLRLGERQLVAIAKALSSEARILIMDEPTAALSAAEAEHLFGVVRELRGRGVGVVYISHRLEEVPRIATRVTVMRDGAVVGQAPPDAPQAELVRMLVGRAFEDLFPPRAERAGREILRLEHARFEPDVERAGFQAPQDVSMTVHEGEIVGLSGLMGVGRTELFSALYGFGTRGRWHGTVLIVGRAAQLGTVAAARRAGIAYVTDDRRGTGLILHHSVAENVVMSTLRRVTPFGLVSRSAEQEQVGRALNRFDIRPRLPLARVLNLSGGNQQKVVFAKELLTDPRLLLLDEPTRGVDVGAKAEIYRQLRALADKGLGVLVASSELPELLGLCDRILVMHAGRTVAEFGPGASEQALRRASTGEGIAA